MALLSDVLSGIGGGLREALPVAVGAAGQGFLAGAFPEKAIEMREAERARLWKEEEQRRRESAAMTQLEKRLLEERLLREEMFEKKSEFDLEMEESRQQHAEELNRLKMNWELGLKMILEGTPKGREAGYGLLKQWAPQLQEFFEGKGVTPEAITPEVPTAAPPSITTPQLKEGAVVEPTVSVTKGKPKIPQLIAKELKTPPEFAELEYGMNAVGMSSENQMQVMSGFVKLLLEKKLSNPAYQITGKPDKGPGGLIWANFKNGDFRPLTDDKGRVIPFIEIKGSGEQGFWRIDHYRLGQGAKDAIQMVVPPAERTDPLNKREQWCADAINLHIPSSEVFKFGDEGKARISRKGLLWKDPMNIPWGPKDAQGNQPVLPIEDVIKAIGNHYFLDLSAEWNPKDKAWNVVIVSDLAAKYKAAAPDVPTHRITGAPVILKPTTKAIRDQVWAHALKAAKGDKAKARDLAAQYLMDQGYDPEKMTTEGDELPKAQGEAVPFVGGQERFSEFGPPIASPTPTPSPERGF